MFLQTQLYNYTNVSTVDKGNFVSEFLEIPPLSEVYYWRSLHPLNIPIRPSDGPLIKRLTTAPRSLDLIDLQLLLFN